MKNLLFTLFALVSLGATAQIKWMTLEEAIAAQQQEPKKIMMDVYTNWCGPCKLLDKMTFTNEDLVAYVNEKFYAVKFNAEGEHVLNYKGKQYFNPNYDPTKEFKRNYSHEFTDYMGIRGYPSIVFMDENANFIMPVTGFLSARQLEVYLKLFGENAYKEISTKEQFQAYEQDFQHQFKS